MREYIVTAILIVCSILNVGYLADTDILKRKLSQAIQEDKHSVTVAKASDDVDYDYPYEIATTNYGWNTPADFNFSRRILTSEFFNATKSHERYNASAWADLEANPDPNRTLVVYLDIDSCYDFLYPKYVQRKWWVNAEGEAWGRTSGGGYMDPLHKSCQYISRAATSPALTANPKSRLVVLNCFGFERTNLKRICGDSNQTFRENIVEKNQQIVFASYSERKSDCRENHDLGLAPPAVKPVELDEKDREAIQSCQKRKYLFSFQGRGGFGREKLLDAAGNDTDVFVRIENPRNYQNDRASPGSDTLKYRDLLLKSTFGATPKGDSLYSYRFTETISAGTIPVVFADDWLPPFNEHVIQWENAAVFIDEKDMHRTTEILRAIPAERVCKMQNYVLHIWDLYLSDRAGWVRGLTKAALAQSNITIKEEKLNAQQAGNFTQEGNSIS